MTPAIAPPGGGAPPAAGANEPNVPGLHPGANPLIEAAALGRPADLAALLAAGADVEAPHGVRGGTAYVWACHQGQLQCAQALAAAGCDLTAAGNDGRTALICAASEGQTEVMKFLLTAEGGAVELLESRDEAGATAILAACREGHLESAKMLRGAGGETATVTTEGLTALHAAAQGGHAKVLGWLLTAEGGAAELLDAQEENGATAFSLLA